MADKYYVAGIDGGGSKTECAIVDQDGHCLAIGHGGPSNIFYADFSKVVESLDTAITSAIENAGGWVKVALTGCTHRVARIPEVKARISARLSGDIRLYTEGEAALGSAGFTERFGIALIAGTGSSAFGFTHDGRCCRAGGWGMLLGDEGGAYDIAINGLRSAARMMDGRGPKTVILDHACEHFGISPDFESFVQFFKDATRDKIASFAPMVTSAACRGDEAAEAIVSNAMNNLADCVIALGHKLFSTNDKFPVALHGGVLRDSRMAEGVTALIKERYPNADVRTPIYSPGVGLALFVLYTKHMDSQ
ncbi:MAG: BadF/BadG/BcrA/BcrD ATPase family protein [Armatimonadota bacterium]